jgi:dolichol-phosphate mannosyltransferase
MIHVIYPAFNEVEVIGLALLSLEATMRGASLDYRAILVDDGSTDGTVAEAERAVVATEGRLPLVVLSHQGNQGLGAALRTGIYGVLADAADDDVIVTLDADGTHPPALIHQMLPRIVEGADIVVASRYVDGATVTGVPGYRLVLSEGIRWLLRVLFPIEGLRDYTCGFRMMRVGALRRARAVYGDELAAARGFEATLDLLLCLRTVGIRAAEIPLQLDYGPRVGRSKMRVLRTIRRTLVVIGRRSLDRVTRYSPGRVRARLTGAGGGSAR